MIQLFDYQQNDVDRIRKAFASGKKSVLYCLPTGGGKTVIFSYIASQILKKNKKVVIITDRQELLDGSAKALVKFHIHPFLIKPGVRLNSSHSVYIAMSQTLKRRIKDPAYMEWLKSHFDLVIIDECHKEEFNVFFEQEVFKNSMVLGVTATPKRKGKSRQLFLDYQVLIEGPDVQDLVNQEYLAMPIYHYSEKLMDYSMVRHSKISGEEDYNQQDMAAMYDVDKVGANLIESWEAYAKEKTTIVFCAGSANTIKACKLFNESGYSAKYLISDPEEEKGKELHSQYKTMYSGERKQLIKDWKAGKFKIMVNNGILTTGFDYPGIECVVLNRATMSQNLYLQMIGRGSRVIKGVKHEFHVIDMSDNVMRLKKWHIPRDYSLVHKAKGDGDAPVKQCPDCGGYVHASLKVCPRFHPKRKVTCQHRFIPPERLQVELLLKTVRYGDLEYHDIVENFKHYTMKEIWDIAKAKGFKKGWIWHQCKKMDRLKEFEEYEEFLMLQ